MKDVLLISTGLCAGNFIWQAMESANYGAALERSFFQFCAIALFYWLNKEKWAPS